MHLLIRLIAAMELLDKIEAVINLFFVVIQSAPYKNELFLGFGYQKPEDLLAGPLTLPR